MEFNESHLNRMLKIQGLIQEDLQEHEKAMKSIYREPKEPLSEAYGKVLARYTGLEGDTLRTTNFKEMMFKTYDVKEEVGNKYFELASIGVDSSEDDWKLILLNFERLLGVTLANNTK